MTPTKNQTTKGKKITNYSALTVRYPLGKRILQVFSVMLQNVKTVLAKTPLVISKL